MRKICLIFFSALPVIVLLTLCILWYLSFKIPTNSGKGEVILHDKSRTRWIKHKIEKGVPVILIVGNKNYLHYITVLGYSESCFYIYDPALALDKNGDQVGNISKPIDEVLDWWKSAFFKIFHLNLAISK